MSPKSNVKLSHCSNHCFAMPSDDRCIEDKRWFRHASHILADIEVFQSLLRCHAGFLRVGDIRII
jgi:hypothetical protein